MTAETCVCKRCFHWEIHDVACRKNTLVLWVEPSKVTSSPSRPGFPSWCSKNWRIFQKKETKKRYWQPLAFFPWCISNNCFDSSNTNPRDGFSSFHLLQGLAGNPNSLIYGVNRIFFFNHSISLQMLVLIVLCTFLDSSRKKRKR